LPPVEVSAGTAWNPRQFPLSMHFKTVRYRERGRMFGRKNAGVFDGYNLGRVSPCLILQTGAFCAVCSRMGPTIPMVWAYVLPRLRSIQVQRNVHADSQFGFRIRMQGEGLVYAEGVGGLQNATPGCPLPIRQEVPAAPPERMGAMFFAERGTSLGGSRVTH